MNELIFAFMQRGMSYRQAEEEIFQGAKTKGIPQGNQGRLMDWLTNTSSSFCLASHFFIDFGRDKACNLHLAQRP
jgi:hypothetical protein